MLLDKRKRGGKDTDFQKRQKMGQHGERSSFESDSDEFEQSDSSKNNIIDTYSRETKEI